MAFFLLPENLLRLYNLNEQKLCDSFAGVVN